VLTPSERIITDIRGGALAALQGWTGGGFWLGKRESLANGKPSKH
jgi:hypothetical protein